MCFAHKSSICLTPSHNFALPWPIKPGHADNVVLCHKHQGFTAPWDLSWLPALPNRNGHRVPTCRGEGKTNMLRKFKEILLGLEEHNWRQICCKKSRKQTGPTNKVGILGGFFTLDREKSFSESQTDSQHFKELKVLLCYPKPSLILGLWFLLYLL